MKYSKARREAVVRKMLPPSSRSIHELAKEEGIATATLYAWRKAARSEGRLLPDHGTVPDGWGSKDKFAAVLETASMNEEQIAEYCRKRGIFPVQIRKWRQACEKANDWAAHQSEDLKEQRKTDKKRLKQLKSELRRKERALAETAALLVLTKKAEAIWGKDEEE